MQIDEDAKVVNSIIMSDCVIGKNVIIDKAILSSGVTVKPNTVVGNSKDIALIDENAVIESNSIG